MINREVFIHASCLMCGHIFVMFMDLLGVFFVTLVYNNVLLQVLRWSMHCFNPRRARANLRRTYGVTYRAWYVRMCVRATCVK